jgi:2-methylisocitrate lyase-like PEP mutase family enzyme
MDKNIQIKKAIKFQELHSNGLFYLPNTWNGGSAKIFEKEGFKALGTTSAGIAYSKGYADGEIISFDILLRTVEEIIRAVDVPVSVDMERGYAESLEEVLRNTEKIINLGVSGINIEDGLPGTQTPSVDSLDYFVDKIKAVSKMRDKIAIPFVINARTDIYLLQTGSGSDMLEAVTKRAAAVKEAGADCIFIPGALDEKTIQELRAEIDMPINLFVHSTFNDAEKLKKIGINRLSSGSAPIRTVFNKLIEISSDFRKGNCTTMLDHSFSYKSANDYFNN